MMKEETIIRLMHSLSNKLNGKISAYKNYYDRSNFITDVETILNDLRDLLEELKEVDNND